MAAIIEIASYLQLGVEFTSTLSFLPFFLTLTSTLHPSGSQSSDFWSPMAGTPSLSGG
uniref:Uncharacterized protein MANES_14G027100 n=1 Tax=Rhizophora mucronata TaxID=61149 RepID=A0A2P2K5N6_RHIMU